MTPITAQDMADGILYEVNIRQFTKRNIQRFCQRITQSEGIGSKYSLVNANYPFRRLKARAH